eukprot:TRINITY_DN34669_c0_g1_i1.p1 TRINITY_DN34669_c0_g1~~TRINITY_DN34669_c0_g1_i1.p1  ORF type:complete len:326 (-),score=15.40 TRINITY_DN34669_c0_g1_i1:177-1154(-)
MGFSNLANVALRLLFAVLILRYAYAGLGAFGTVFVFFFLSFVGVVKIFPVMYAFYTSRAGYYIKDFLHPRMEDRHSKCMPTNLPGITILPIAILADNYAYTIVCNETKKAVVVDAADPDVVLKSIPEGAELTHVLTTHKHWDHAGGNYELAQKFKGKIEVVGSEIDKPSATTYTVKDKDVLTVGNMRFDIHHGPGHTKGHVIYQLTSLATPTAMDEDKPRTALFTGDALFVGGVGAFFEGASSDLYTLYNLLHQLPAEAYVFCGHEYSFMLMSQAATLMPNNKLVLEKLQQIKAKRGLNQCTMPSTLAIERKTNPFLMLGKYERL